MAGFEPIAHSEADYQALQEAYQRLVLDRDALQRQVITLQAEKVVLETKLVILEAAK